MSFGQDVAKPIVLGQVYLSFDAVTGAVLHEVLERLGHRVEVREGPHEQVFPLLGQGVIARTSFSGFRTMCRRAKSALLPTWRSPMSRARWRSSSRASGSEQR